MSIPGGIPRITTDRLTLRPFTAEDVGSMHRILNGAGVLRYFPRSDPPPRERVREMILGQHSHWKEHGYGLWAVEARSTGELMGRSGLRYLPETDEVEVDFILGSAHWGKGFATEAGRAGLRYGFEEIGLHSVVGIVHPENAASRRVLDKLGMAFTGTAEYFGMACYRYAIERSSYHRVSVSWHCEKAHSAQAYHSGWNDTRPSLASLGRHREEIHGARTTQTVRNSRLSSS